MEHPQQTIDQFIELRSQGIPYSQIVKLLGVSKPTLIQWSREHNETINNLRAMNLADVSETHYLVKKKRVELLGGTLERIREELSKRDLSEIPTEKLLKHQIDCLNLLKQEEVSVTFAERDASPLSSPFEPPKYVQWQA